MARQRSKATSSKAIPLKKKSPKVPASIKDDKMILLWMCLSNHSGEVRSLFFHLFISFVHSPDPIYRLTLMPLEPHMAYPAIQPNSATTDCVPS